MIKSELKYKKGDKDFVVVYRDKTIETHNALKTILRLDVDFIIKRTFKNYSGGQKSVYYFKNRFLSNTKKSIKNNSINFGGIKVKIIKDEHWAKFEEGKSNSAVFIEFEITDKLNEKKTYRKVAMNDSLYENLINELTILDKVGTHQAVKEINSLQFQLDTLKSK
tara:strand:- start:3277 stop:3771 length:495 start_codon:yes stop_codon:yes gene_type:complete